MLLAACGGETALQNTAVHYAHSELGISVDYSPDLFLVSRDYGTNGVPRLVLTWVEDSPDARRFLAGEQSAFSESPPVLTLEVFANPRGLNAEDWISSSTNWIISDKPRETVSIDGRAGLTFYWDGLYAGKSAVVTDARRTYVISVSWLTDTDPLLAHFDNVIGSIGLPPAP